MIVVLWGYIKTGLNLSSIKFAMNLINQDHLGNDIKLFDYFVFVNLDLEQWAGEDSPGRRKLLYIYFLIFEKKNPPKHLTN